MSDYPLVPLKERFWRMLRIPYQFEPISEEGARRYGGRWNRPGVPALYLAADHATAVAEFHQGYAIPGTLAAYDIQAQSIADLTDGDGGAINAAVREAIDTDWLQLARIEGKVPPSWKLFDLLIKQGAEGALAPSVQNRGGAVLVLWRWGEAGGARVSLYDPDGDLS